MDCKLVFIGLLMLAACSSKKDATSDKLSVITTTGMIADAVKEIAEDKVNVQALMGPGVDPHLYKATQGDLSKLTSADLILYNGLHLEGKMGEVLEKLARQKPVVAITANIDTSLLHRVPQYNSYDPHIWFDVALWKKAVGYIGDYLIEFDTINAVFYRANTLNYLSKLDELDQTVREQIATVPIQQRVLITAHDAFGYYGEAYNIEVKGLQGISTLSEYGLRDVSELVKSIIERNIKAVFIETSISEKAINAVVEGCKQKGFDVKIGGNLYSDAMGAEGTPEGKYLGMVTANTKTIVDALK